MGKKLGNALIIYGILNFIVGLFFLPTLPLATVGTFFWMIILIFLGNWQRSKARSEAARDKQTQLLEQSVQKMDAFRRAEDVKRSDLSDAINSILDERERRTRESLK